MTRRPNHVDLHVGARLRMQRKLLGMSQDQLAGKLGLTFQQIQKYERGTNRVSASKLYTAATALDVPVSFFFDGITEASAENNAESTDMENLTVLLGTSEGMELLRYFPQIATPANRRRVLNFIQALAEEEAGQASES